MSQDTDGVELTRRRILGSLGVIGVAAGGAGAGTMAYFQDTESSTGNTIDAGTLDLKLSDGDEFTEDGVSGTWTISNAKPGDSVTSEVVLTNAGSLEADHVEFGVSVDETEADGPNGNNEPDTRPSSAEGMAEQFEVTTMEYNETDILGNRLSDANENGIIDVGDLASGNDAELDGLTPPPSANGGMKSLRLNLRWAHDDEFDNSVSGINNDYQGDELDITVTMALYQDSSQNL
jgi:spore coat-associated protein N